MVETALARGTRASYSLAVMTASDWVEQTAPARKSETQVYEAPLLYDVAFSFRDYPAETGVLEAWYRRASGNTQISSVLELACGPCAHALEFVARGASATGLDISANMCAYARSKAQSLGRPLEVECADMIDFDLGKTFDLAILMLNSVGHIYTLDALVKHFTAVGRHLSPGGVYVIEMPHPNNFLGRTGRAPGVGVGLPWRVRRGELEVEVTWGTEDDPYDAIAQIFDARVEIRASDGTGEQVLVERCPMRDWTKTELDAALQLSGCFELSELHGEITADAPFDNTEASWRMFTVLRRLHQG